MFAIQSTLTSIQLSLVDLLTLNFPAITLVVLISLFVTREPGLLIAAAVAVLMMYQTMVYAKRLICLLPYGLALVSGAVTAARVREAEGFSWAVLKRALVVLLVWNGGTVRLLRPVIALGHTDVNAQTQLRQAAMQSIGRGDYRVLFEAWNAYYYVGRDLGWKMFRPGAPFSTAEFSGFLATMDYAIVDNPPYHAITLNMLK